MTILRKIFGSKNNTKTTTLNSEAWVNTGSQYFNGSGGGGGNAQINLLGGGGTSYYTLPPTGGGSAFIQFSSITIKTSTGTKTYTYQEIKTLLEDLQLQEELRGHFPIMSEPFDKYLMALKLCRPDKEK
jgi:hypothetical protein